jgi:hypothetical protein
MSYLVRFEVECEVTLKEDGEFPNDLAIVEQAVREHLAPHVLDAVKIRPCHVEPLEEEDED